MPHTMESHQVLLQPVARWAVLWENTPLNWSQCPPPSIPAGITHQFSIELCSTFTPCLSPIKHWHPICLWISIFHPMIIIRTAYIALPLIIMSNPDTLKSIFKDPSDLEMENLTKPSHILKLKWLIQSLHLLNVTRAPSWHFLLSLSLLLLWVSELTAPTSNDITITSIIPTDPLFPPCVWLLTSSCPSPKWYGLWGLHMEEIVGQ